MVVTTGVLPLFTATNELILPDPLAGRPIEVLLLVQVITAPGVVLVMFRLPVLSPLQKAAAVGTERFALELIVNCLLTVVVPHSFVTAKLTVCKPGVVNAIVPGFATEALPAGAPSNNHAYVSEDSPQPVITG